MLKVTDNGVDIKLVGEPSSPLAVALFVALFALVIGIGVAFTWLDGGIAAGLLVVVAVISWFFNNKRRHTCIDSGIVTVNHLQFNHNDGTHERHYQLTKDDSIHQKEDMLIITDSHGKEKVRLTSFENAKELQVMQAVLQGKQLQKRRAVIKMAE